MDEQRPQKLGCRYLRGAEGRLLQTFQNAFEHISVGIPDYFMLWTGAGDAS